MAALSALTNNDAKPATCLLIRTQTCCPARLVQKKNPNWKINKADLDQLCYEIDCEMRFSNPPTDIQSQYEQPQNPV